MIKAIDKFGKPTIIMCSKVLNENNLSKEELTDWWNWRKRSIPTHSGWLYPLTFDAEKGLKEA